MLIAGFGRIPRIDVYPTNVVSDLAVNVYISSILMPSDPQTQGHDMIPVLRILISYFQPRGPANSIDYIANVL